MQSISFLPRPRHDCQGELKPSRVPAWGVRASLDSSDNAEPGRPSPWRSCRCCLRSMRKPRHSGSCNLRCSIIPATRTATDASCAPSRVNTHGSRWKWWLAFPSCRTCTDSPAPVSSALPTATAATGVQPISPAANTARQIPTTWRRDRRSRRNPRHDRPSGPSCAPTPARLRPATLPGRWRRRARARMMRTERRCMARAGSAARVRPVDPRVASRESASRSAVTDPTLRKKRCSVFALPFPLKRVQIRAPPRNRSPRG